MRHCNRRARYAHYRPCPWGEPLLFRFISHLIALQGIPRPSCSTRDHFVTDAQGCDELPCQKRHGGIVKTSHAPSAARPVIPCELPGSASDSSTAPPCSSMSPRPAQWKPPAHNVLRGCIRDAGLARAIQDQVLKCCRQSSGDVVPFYLITFLGGCEETGFVRKLRNALLAEFDLFSEWKAAPWRTC